MASSYTDNSGIELIGVGEQSGGNNGFGNAGNGGSGIVVIRYKFQ